MNFRIIITPGILAFLIASAYAMDLDEDRLRVPPGLTPGEAGRNLPAPSARVPMIDRDSDVRPGFTGGGGIGLGGGSFGGGGGSFGGGNSAPGFGSSTGGGNGAANGNGIGGGPSSLGAALSSPRKATRLFGGPGQYPPPEYAAYAIVAFSASVSAETRERYDYICRAYLRALPPPPVDLPPLKQLVTVWPVFADETATRLTESAVEGIAEEQAVSICKDATINYHLSLGQQAIRIAEGKGINVGGRGPFLIAWAPTTDINHEDTIILFMNLSDADDFISAKDHFQVWVNEIEADPEVWGSGFNVKRLRLKFRTIINVYGRRFENVFFTEG